MQNFLIPANVLNAIGLYLMSKPMQEVEQLVQAIRACRPYDPATEGQAPMDPQPQPTVN